MRCTCIHPPKEGNMMSELSPHHHHHHHYLLPVQPSEQGRGWGGVCVCGGVDCRCWVKRVSNNNLHLRLERLPHALSVCSSKLSSTLLATKPARLVTRAPDSAAEWMKFFTVKVSLWKTLPRMRRPASKKTKGMVVVLRGGVEGMGGKLNMPLSLSFTRRPRSGSGSSRPLNVALGPLPRTLRCRTAS